MRGQIFVEKGTTYVLYVVYKNSNKTMNLNINFKSPKFLAITAKSQSVGGEMTHWSKGVKRESRGIWGSVK